MKYFSMLSCFIFVLLIGCNDLSSKAENDLREFVQQWNASHTQLKAPYLSRDYMDVVNYYGKERTRSQVQQDKKMLLEQFPDYTQRILNDDLVIIEEAGSFLVTFTKQVHYNGIDANYVSYLSVINKNGNFKILREGVAENSENNDAPIFPNARETSASILSNRQLFGDFNGDGLSDYATVISPKLKSTTNSERSDSGIIECDGACNSKIIFSNSDLEPISIEGAYKSQLENLKDLNRDGADEIGFWDIKPTTKTLYVYEPTTGKLLTDPIMIKTTVHKNLQLIDVFKKSGVNKITITRSVEEEGKWRLKSDVIVLE